MGELLLSAHVLAAIIFVGPVTVAVSLFPRSARLALAHRTFEIHGAGTLTYPGADAADVPVPTGSPGDDGDPGAGAPVAAGGTASGDVTGSGDGDARAEPVARLLHRISRVYAVLGISVPVLGLALGAEMGVLADAWLVASIALTGVAAVLLAAVVLPAQQRAIVLLDGPGQAQHGFGAAVAGWVAGAKRLSMSSGVFALLWAVVVVLMVVRPGSTTGV